MKAFRDDARNATTSATSSGSPSLFRGTCSTIDSQLAHRVVLPRELGRDESRCDGIHQYPAPRELHRESPRQPIQARLRDDVCAAGEASRRPPRPSLRSRSGRSLARPSPGAKARQSLMGATRSTRSVSSSSRSPRSSIPCEDIDARVVHEDVDGLTDVSCEGLDGRGPARSSSSRVGARTRAPSSSNRSTMARPMPRDPPVTRAVRPSHSYMPPACEISRRSVPGACRSARGPPRRCSRRSPACS